MRFLKPSILLGFLIALDQLLKIYFTKLPSLRPCLNFFVNLQCNQQIAWGIQISPLAFYPVWLAITLFILLLFLKSKSLKEQLPLLLILSGALGNMIDRLVRGCVIDFIDFKFWPIFNLADVYITAGIILLIIQLLKNRKPFSQNFG